MSHDLVTEQCEEEAGVGQRYLFLSPINEALKLALHPNSLLFFIPQPTPLLTPKFSNPMQYNLLRLQCLHAGHYTSYNLDD